MSEHSGNLTEFWAKGCCPPVPESIVTANRCELTNIKLNKIDGTLPDDLQGHVFIVAPVGSVDSGGIPYPDGTPIFNGDGMIYRLDFDQMGEVSVTTRLTKPPCYRADWATRPGTRYEKYGFANHGFARFSLFLGSRDQLNTAFLPMKFSQDPNERLLVTCDAGRPYEIDTETLEVVTPVGWNKEWRPEVALKFPFPPVLSNAHPVFDPYTEEMFTVNYGRSLANLLETIPFIYEIDELPKEIDEFLAAIAQFFQQDFVRDLSSIFSQFSQEMFHFSVHWIGKMINIEIQDFVYLIRWDGQGALERWRVVLPDGSPLKIQQTMHQIGLTQDYIVLLDTALQFGVEQVLNHPFPRSKGVEKLLRVLLTRPQSPDSTFYIVRRADLKAGQRPAGSPQDVTVVARKVLLPLESIHFLVDYDNPDHQITFHVEHICAWDGSGWLHNYDSSAADPREPIPSRLYGMINEERDISRIGRYTVNGESGEVLKSQVMYNSDLFWGVAFYTYRDRLVGGMAPGKLDNIYWTSLGLWKDLMTQFYYELYKDYKYRAVSPEELLSIANEGRPAYLFRVQESNEVMQIADCYRFPDGYMVNSTQFVPRRDGDSSSTNGYIVCTVFSQTSNEIWIFDANDLKRGGEDSVWGTQKPLCRLEHPSLNFGFTIHTAWLPKIARRTAGYHVPVRQDYEALVKQNSPEIQELFEQEIYPYYEETPSGVS